MLVLCDLDRSRPATRHIDRDDLAFEKPAGLPGGVFALRPRGEDVASLASDLIVTRQIVRGLGHRVGAELAFDLWVRKARADCRIKDAAVATEGSLRLVHNIRRAAHALDPAGDKGIALAAGDRLRRHDDGVEPAAAIALQDRARHLDRQTGEKPGMTPDAAAVLAGLVGAADDDVLYFGGVERALFDDGGNNRGQHV